jgi:3-hydroxyisobutyrate dehydrogenase-like beta-hydroxyacid dehydrogenase
MGMQIGFIGAGTMGGGMAANLVAKGYQVKLFNRTRARAEAVAAGRCEVVESPAAAARGARVVVIMLADTDAVVEVLEGPDGVTAGLEPGATVIDCSTISPQASIRLGQVVEARGASMLDAPVLGSKTEAANGTLRFVVGGSRSVFDAVRDVFGPMGEPTYVGPSGAGLSAKLAFNLVIAASLEAFNEGMVFATKAGIDPSLMFEILQFGRAKSGIAEAKGPRILARDFQPFFRLVLMNKDLQLALEEAHRQRVSMPAVAATKQLFSAAVAGGQADEDMCSVIRQLEQASGVVVAAGGSAKANG